MTSKNFTVERMKRQLEEINENIIENANKKYYDLVITYAIEAQGIQYKLDMIESR